MLKQERRGNESLRKINSQSKTKKRKQKQKTQKKKKKKRGRYRKGEKEGRLSMVTPFRKGNEKILEEDELDYKASY